MHTFFPSFFLLLLLFSCSSQDEYTAHSVQKAEYIYRMSHEHSAPISPPVAQAHKGYPWTKGSVGGIPKITKEFFRCRGSNLNPVKIVQEKGEVMRYFDCGGSGKHSLPLCNDKEFIYPILIDLANYIQNKTHKRVVITSGYRCPDHNTYVDPSPKNRFSKHMVGAEFSFYVQGYEEKPEQIIKLLQNYYKEEKKYEGKKDFIEFKRYEKKDVDVSTPPWLNKEIFIKLYRRNEGRNFDNRHPYPYISIQVRYDLETQQKVIYTWDKAFHNFHRY